jgi:hypothetical protein
MKRFEYDGFWSAMRIVIIGFKKKEKEKEQKKNVAIRDNSLFRSFVLFSRTAQFKNGLMQKNSARKPALTINKK